MAQENTSVWKKVGVYMLLLAFVGFVTYLMSNFLGLAGTGFESGEILNLQTFYLTGGIFAFFMTALFIYQVAIKKGDNRYGSSIGFSSLGEFPHLRIFKRFTIPQITLLSFIIFSILAIFNLSISTAQRTYTSMGLLETQQFTQGQSLLYSALLIPGAENLGAALVFAMIITLLGYYARKTNMNPNTFFVLLIVLSFFGLGLFGLGNHLLRYSGQEISLLVVFFFWGLGGVITALTGVFTIFWMMHITNNGMFDLSRFLPIDNLIIYIAITALIMSVIYVLIYRGRLFGEIKEKNLEV